MLIDVAFSSLKIVSLMENRPNRLRQHCIVTTSSNRLSVRAPDSWLEVQQLVPEVLEDLIPLSLKAAILVVTRCWP